MKLLSGLYYRWKRLFISLRTRFLENIVISATVITVQTVSTIADHRISNDRISA